MAKYKGFDIDDDVYSVIRHMGNVKHYYEELQRQQVSWDYLSVMAKLANLDNELTHAKQDFANLTGILLNRLGLETLNKSANEYAFKAQVAINVLNRNLFERTADIGFLAADEAIRHFLQAVTRPIGVEKLADMRSQLKQHFQEYVNKYSVYEDVVLLDKEGQILVRLNEREPMKLSIAPLINKSLFTQHAYVETYGEIDFMVNSHNNLVYSYRVESEQGEAIGVICLCFKFENECAGIFKRLLDRDDSAMLMLLNKDGQVLTTSHASEVPTNTQFRITRNTHFNVMNYNNREYFCCVKSADVYQGYAGAGWLGFLMVPVEVIFKQKKEIDALILTPKVLSVAQQGDLFNEETKKITVMANQIQSTLDRSVWNGNVYQASEKNGSDAAVSKVLLSEIKNTGISTKRIFEHSISEIQTTIIQTTLKQSEANALLAMEIMDRNLYERANDCRWWALNDTLRKLLSQPALQADEVKGIEDVLKNINHLYTVYSNLVVFDRQGKIIVVSNPEYAELIDKTLQEHWVHAACQLQTSEQYVVSEFTPTPLYDGQPSYIYASAIRSPNNQRVVGGIGIVFDANVQFSAMLQDVIPKKMDGSPQANCFAVYIDANKKIISSSSARFAVGELFDIDDEFLHLNKGQSCSKISPFGQHYYAIGVAKSAGYREYKGANDQYQQDVYAIVMIEIGEDQPLSLIDQAAQYHQPKGMFGYKGKTQIATFYVDGHWLGFHSERIASAVSVQQLVPIHTGDHSLVAGYMIYKGDSMLVVHTDMLMGAAEPPTKPVEEVVVIKVAGKFVGLSVDRLGEIIDIESEMIQPISEQLAAANKVVRQIVMSNPESSDQNMLKIMDVALIAKSFKDAMALAVS